MGLFERVVGVGERRRRSFWKEGVDGLRGPFG